MNGYEIDTPKANIPIIFISALNEALNRIKAFWELDIMRKILEKHRRRISFESQPGKITFHVLLPGENAP